MPADSDVLPEYISFSTEAKPVHIICFREAQFLQPLIQLKMGCLFNQTHCIILSFHFEPESSPANISFSYLENHQTYIALLKNRGKWHQFPL